MGKTPLKRSDIEFGFECGVDLPSGPGRTTHCSQCDKQVWDVAKLTREEFGALPNSACVVLTYDDDGVIDFAPEPSATARLRHAAAVGLFGLLLAGCDAATPASPVTHPPEAELAIERPIELNEPTATIPNKISRAMLLEIHRELYGKYPDARATRREPPAGTDQSEEFPGGNHRDILQQKRNIRERVRKVGRKKTMGAIRVTYPSK